MDTETAEEFRRLREEMIVFAKAVGVALGAVAETSGQMTLLDAVITSFDGASEERGGSELLRVMRDSADDFMARRRAAREQPPQP